MSATSLSTTTSGPHTFMLNLAFHWLVILLLRPFFKPHIPLRSREAVAGGASLSRNSSLRSQHRDSILLKLREAALKECPSAAAHIVSLFGAYRRLYGLRLSTITAVQIAYIAGKTHLVAILAAAGAGSSSTASRKARGDFLECVQILREIGETWSSGKVTAEMLLDLLARGEEKQRQQQAGSAMLVDRHPATRDAAPRLYAPPPYPPPTYQEGSVFASRA